jgi:hypothetical protein
MKRQRCSALPRSNATLQALAPSLTSLLLHHPYQPDPLPHISALTALRQLAVSHANISMGVEGLVRLTALTALALPACALQALPAAIWALPQLQVKLSPVIPLLVAGK